MSDERINEFILLEKKDIINLFQPFDSSLKVLDFAPMKNGMSNSGYCVMTTKGKYLLKLYSSTTDTIETAMFGYLRNIINVPRLYYYSCDKRYIRNAYTITEYIEGMTLLEYIYKNKAYPIETAYTVGKMCAEIHSKKHIIDAILDINLNAVADLPPTREKIMYLLSSRPGEFLHRDTSLKLQNYIKDNQGKFDEIEEESVLLHGDMSYGNIMLSGNRVYFIDFEFAFAGSRYHDIGHFFRRKDADMQLYIDDGIYDAFAKGYNSSSDNPLPADWLKLARLCDIDAMLCLLNHNNIPAQWVSDIEYDILCSIRDY